MNILEISSASTGRPYIISAFLIKLRIVYYRAGTLLRRWSNIDFLLKKNPSFFSFIFLKTDSFWYIFQKESVLSSLYSKVAAWILQGCNSTERNSTIDIFLRNFQNQIIFCEIFICAEEADYMKDYMKAKMLESLAGCLAELYASDFCWIFFSFRLSLTF